MRYAGVKLSVQRLKSQMAATRQSSLLTCISCMFQQAVDAYYVVMFPSADPAELANKPWDMGYTRQP